jgi:hypothetical protein
MGGVLLKNDIKMMSDVIDIETTALLLSENAIHLLTFYNTAFPQTLSTSRDTTFPQTLSTSRDTTFPQTLSTSRDTAFPQTLSTSRDTAFPQTLSTSRQKGIADLSGILKSVWDFSEMDNTFPCSMKKTFLAMKLPNLLIEDHFGDEVETGQRFLETNG